MQPVVRQILHVDMDAFYASVEQNDDPSLRGRPVLVGGPVSRGVVAAASYEARPFGVRSAMSMAEALRRCPDAVVLPGRHARYAEVSEQVFAIFRRYTPLVEGLSLDEAFLDATGSRALFGDGARVAARIKENIRAETGLTASAGVAPCKFVAKIASDLRKPDGLVVVAAGEVAGFLAPLPIERMWGVGPKTATRLREVGLETIGDLARAAPERLEHLLGTWGTKVHALARGDDERDVQPGWAAKSVGAEETFADDVTTRVGLERHLLQQAGRVAQRLLLDDLRGRTVTVKVKYADFSIRTRQLGLPAHVCDTDSIYVAARELLGRFSLEGRRVRLTGVSVSDLLTGPPPADLFPDPVLARRQKIQQVVADVAGRFGDRLKRATLLDEDS